MPIDELLDQYAAGPGSLREAVAGMSQHEITARPVPGRWSTLEVLCHLADAEAVYAERLKRVIAEDEPPLRGFDPEIWHPRLAYDQRDAEEELKLIELVRGQMLRILRPLAPADFQRTGFHSEAGLMTLETLLERVTNHIPHHAAFIHEKRQALARS
ncbi:MAG TPA: DinB family protein [Pirellulales bacterium]|nr:DinB family protein [Pirellulales bacterium]